MRNLVPLVVLSLPLMSGCVAVAAGAAAGGGAGYYISKEEDRKDDQVSADNAITLHVKDRLAQDPDLAAMHLSVDTYNGVVTLNGTVPDATVAEHAMAAARGVDGVKGVRSEITIH